MLDTGHQQPEPTAGLREASEFLSKLADFFAFRHSASRKTEKTRVSNTYHRTGGHRLILASRVSAL